MQLNFNMNFASLLDSFVTTNMGARQK